jgi:hypothetical protein
MSFKFKCETCGQVHEGIPSFRADKPLTSASAIGFRFCSLSDKAPEKPCTMFCAA